MSFLVLTKAQADAVRGETKPGFALMPIEQKDGTFILPDAVLTDPAHAIHASFLSGMPRSDSVIPKVSNEQ